jgi:hypothetical protein
MKQSASKLVKEHLLKHGSITTHEAFAFYGATRLSAIIFNLRDRGYDITTTYETTVSKYGWKTRVARYKLNKGGPQGE